MRATNNGAQGGDMTEETLKSIRLPFGGDLWVKLRE
jgi:hypothetical protein